MPFILFRAFSGQRKSNAYLDVPSAGFNHLQISDNDEEDVDRLRTFSSSKGGKTLCVVATIFACWRARRLAYNVFWLVGSQHYGTRKSGNNLNDTNTRIMFKGNGSTKLLVNCIGSVRSIPKMERWQYWYSLRKEILRGI